MWKVIHKDTVAGVLKVMSTLVNGDVNKLLQLFKSASAKDCMALRSFVAGRLLGSNNEPLGGAQLESLRALPIFESFGSAKDDRKQEDGSVDEVSFVGLNRECVMAPAGTDSRLLTCRFLKVVLEDDARLLKHLGVRQMCGSEFYLEHVFSSLHDLASDVRDQTMLLVLNIWDNVAAGTSEAMEPSR